MTFDQYAAQQQEQNEQRAQDALEAQNINAIADHEAAETFYDLMDTVQCEIYNGTAPTEILEKIVVEMFGDNCDPANMCRKLIEADRTPSVQEVAVATIRAQRSILQRQYKRLKEEQQSITDAIDKLNQEEWRIYDETSRAAETDTSLLDVLTATKQADGPLPLETVAELFKKHHSSPPAMGLLYGYIANRSSRPDVLDIVQQRQYDDLADSVLQAAQGRYRAADDGTSKE